MGVFPPPGRKKAPPGPSSSLAFVSRHLSARSPSRQRLVEQPPPIRGRCALFSPSSHRYDNSRDAAGALPAGRRQLTWHMAAGSTAGCVRRLGGWRPRAASPHTPPGEGGRVARHGGESHRTGGGGGVERRGGGGGGGATGATAGRHRLGRLKKKTQPFFSFFFFFLLPFPPPFFSAGEEARPQR